MSTPTHPAYANPQWRRLSQAILARDNHTCRIGLPGCTIRATTTDHITPLAQGGEWYDPTNLRAACRHCNSALARGHQPPQATTSRQW